MNQGRSIRRGQVAPAIARVVAVLAVALPVSLLATVPLQVEAAGAATTSTTKPPTPTTTTKPPTTTTKPPANAIATLKVTAGEVSVQAKGATSFMAATDGQSLQAGDTVKTGPTGRAEVEYAKDTFTRLDVNTTFTVVRLTDEQGNRRVQGSLDTGRTWNRTATLTQSESFEQKGAGATAAVLGTAFMIECDTVTHCRFVAVDHPIQMTDGAGTQILDPLQAIDVTAGVPSAVTTLTVDQIAAIAWIQQNLLLDKFLGIGDGPFVTVHGHAGRRERRGAVVHREPAAAAPPPAPTAPAGPPTNVSATPAGSGTASVSFTPPADNGGSPITLYTVVATADGQVPVTATGPGSPITVTGLTNGVTYDFTVTASNAVGTGSGSTPVELPIPPTAPGAPSITSAEAAGPTAVNVTFAPPANSGGSPITGYSVVATATGEDARFGTGAGPVITVGSLVDGVTWTFSVTATNAAGTGRVVVAGRTRPLLRSHGSPRDPIDPCGEQTEAPDIDIPLNCFNFFSITLLQCVRRRVHLHLQLREPCGRPRLRHVL